jgi:hypothetical protein
MEQKWDVLQILLKYKIHKQNKYCSKFVASYALLDKWSCDNWITIDLPNPLIALSQADGGIICRTVGWVELMREEKAWWSYLESLNERWIRTFGDSKGHYEDFIHGFVMPPISYKVLIFD